MKLNLRTILILVIAITSLSVIYQDVLTQVILILLSLILILSIKPSKKKFNRLMHRIKLLGKIILTLMVFQILFRPEGEVLLEFWLIKITMEGINYGVASSLRFFLIILIAGLLFDIPFYDYLLAFRSWKFPYEISFLVSSVIHLIPIFNSQFKRSSEALKLRGIDMRKLPLRRRTKAYLSLIFPMVAKSINEVKYRSISLDLRAFRLYKHRTYLYDSKLKWFDVCLQISIIVCFLLIIIFV